jgi:hypothetical protein
VPSFFGGGKISQLVRAKPRRRRPAGSGRRGASNDGWRFRPRGGRRAGCG